ncbi:MAG TPA: hypothetical protein P5572_20215, partial [Phycisphaerae bacterium]|nr:hypothetical protein [Phycisphaerae bacterium]
LDGRIAAWVSAVGAAQSALAGLAEAEARNAARAAARATAASAADVAAAAAVPASEPVAPAADAAAAAAAESPAAPRAAEAPTAQAADEAAPADTAAAKAAKKAGGLRLGHLTEKKAPPPSVKKGILVYEDDTPEQPKVAATAHEEDEALLAQLDPQVARQIRIKRRLGNNTKTVRQLLDEEQKGKKGKK